MSNTVSIDSSRENNTRKIRNRQEIFAAMSTNQKKITNDGLPYQKMVQDFYESNNVQFTVIAVIMINLLIYVVKLQIPSEDFTEGYESFFYILELIFAFLFTIELATNMYGSWFLEFWDSWWNIFDFIIVFATIFGLFFPQIPGVSAFRAFRAMRGFRLMSRLSRLKRIIDAILGTAEDILWTSVILLLFAAIWASLCVELYQEDVPEYFTTWFRTFCHLLKFLFDWTEPVDAILNTRQSTIEQFVAFMVFFSYVTITQIFVMSLVTGIMYDAFLENNSRESSGEVEDAVGRLEIDQIRKRIISITHNIRKTNEETRNRLGRIKAFKKVLNIPPEVKLLRFSEYSESSPK